MSTPEQVTQRARKVRGTFVVTLSVLLVLSAISIWLLATRDSGESEEPSMPGPAEETGLFVPHPGEQREQGRPVKFPRDEHGAVSAYLAYLSAASTADAESLLQTHRIYRGPGVSQESIETTLSYRAGQIEWEKDDTTPFDRDSWPDLEQGAYWFIDPQGVHWEEVEVEGGGGEMFEVQVLATETASDGKQAYIERMEIHYDLMVWDEEIGDWQVRSPFRSHDFTDEEHSPKSDRWQLIDSKDEEE